MNTFEFYLRLNGKEYYIYIDSGNEKAKRILINRKEVVNEPCDPAFTRNAHLTYYPIVIDECEILVSIDDSEFSHEYNVYSDGISLLDQSHLAAEYNHGKNETQKGFSTFLKTNWKDIFKKNLFTMIISWLLIALINSYNMIKTIIVLLLFVVCLPIILLLLVLSEWWHLKSVINNYSKRFKPKKYYKTTP